MPSLKMYRRDVYPMMNEIFQAHRMRKGRDFDYHKTEMVWTFPYTQTAMWVFPSGDGGDSIRGPNLAWGLINEVTMCSESSYEHFLARLRSNRSKVLQLAMSGTPEGFNWVYSRFIEKPRQDTDLIFGDSRKNIYNAQTYIENLENSYDDKMRSQYIEGKFVNILGNTVAWAFDRRIHTATGVKKIPGCPVIITVDFNVNPMSASLFSYEPRGVDRYTGLPTGFKLWGFKTIKLENSNTYSLCDALKRYVDPYGEDVTVYPDPAGRSRDTRSRNAITDFDILRQAGFKNLKYRTRPNIRSGILSMNTLFGSNCVVLDLNECQDLVADLEQCVFAGKESFEIEKKKNPNRTHWLDGFKNYCEMEHPVKVDRKGFREESFL